MACKYIKADTVLPYSSALGSLKKKISNSYLISTYVFDMFDLNFRLILNLLAENSMTGSAQGA